MSAQQIIVTPDFDPEDCCEICGEGWNGGPEAEMFDPATDDVFICHAQCGLSAGYEVA